MSLYRVLDHPLVYTAAQNIFAPGATTGLTRYIADMLDVLPDSDSLLDVGCGPQSWLSRVGKQPAGVDIEPAYVDAYIRNGGKARLGSADELPYTEGSFFGLWCIGVLHHLPDETVMAAVREAIRVTRPRGYIAVLDAVLPVSAARRPLAAVIRRIDRGKHMRKEERLRALLDPYGRWTYDRFTYSATGLEMLACVHRRV
jgi:SAM-dependent methyltransferase